jgi:Zn-dependent protease with chaperone function
MRIRCMAGMRVRNIWCLSDDLLALSLLGPLLCELLFRSWSLFLVLMLFGYGLLEIGSRVSLLRKRATPLKQTDAPWIYEILTTELAKQRIRFGLRPKLYWIPTNWKRTARVLGGFRSKIVLSGGIVVEAQERPEVCRVVIRHEIAHVKGGDTRLYFFLIAIVLFTLSMFRGTLNYFWNVRDELWFSLTDGIGLRQLLLPVLYQLPWFLFFGLLLRRREYLADARAINASESTKDYVDLLVSGYTKEKQGWFHPNSGQRAGAILRDSPVLKASPILIITVLVYVLWDAPLAATFKTLEYVDPEVIRSAWQDWLFRYSFGLLAVVLELTKGWRSKFPLLANGESGRTDLLLGIDVS